MVYRGSPAAHREVYTQDGPGPCGPGLVTLVALSALSVRAAGPDWALRRIWAIAVFPVLEVEHCGRREPADGASC